MNDPDREIIAYCCEHCAYAAADLAGSLRMQYPTSVKLVMMPCTGRIEALTILKSFEAGVDAVMVAG